MKIINNFLFIRRRWADHESTAECINIAQITSIGEERVDRIGNYVAIRIADGEQIVIDGYNSSEDFMIDFVKLLSND